MFSCVLGCNSLIINTIHFSGLHAVAGGLLSEPLIYLILLILMIWVAWVLCFGFILGLFLISGIADNLPVVSCVLLDNSLIINGIHFSGRQAFAGNFCGEVRHTLEYAGCCGNDCGNAL